MAVLLVDGRCDPSIITGASISVSTSIGKSFYLRILLPKFRGMYPDVQVDVHISNRNIDFAEEGCDLARHMSLRVRTFVGFVIGNLAKKK